MPAGAQPVLIATDLVMDYSAAMARTQAGRATTGVGAGPSAAVPGIHTLALNHVSFALAEGESVAVMGPSGSGKSTLLHSLAGIIKPTGGSVAFRGANLTAMSDADRTKLRRGAFGFVFQSGQLLPELPAVENIALPMMLGGMDYRSATDAAMLWLERLGREVMGILMEAAQANGSAVVVVTHDPNVASFCGRTVIMRDGQLYTAEAAAQYGWNGGAR